MSLFSTSRYHAHALDLSRLTISPGRRQEMFIRSSSTLKPSDSSSSPAPVQLLLSSVANKRSSSNPDTLISQVVRLLVPSVRFEASKLDVLKLEEQQVNRGIAVVPRTYILSHCDFTADLTLSISNVINLEQLRGWYSKDEVIAEWKKVNGVMCLHVHCYVSGPNIFSHLVAEFRYHIFSKELPLVLKAILYGDHELFEMNPDLTDSLVWVYFHSDSQKYNRLEYWGPLRDAAEGLQDDQILTYLVADGENRQKGRGGSKSIIQTLFAFLL